MKYKNTKWKAISSKGIWIKLQFNSAQEKEREKNFIRSTNKSRSVLRKKYTNQGVIFVLRMSSFPKWKNERQSKKKKKSGRESLSFYSSPVEKSPWSQLYEAHKKTWKSIMADAGGTGVWGLCLLGLIDRGKARGCKAVGKVLCFGSVLISLLLRLKVSRVEAWWREKHSSGVPFPLAAAGKLLVTSWSAFLCWSRGLQHTFFWK